MKYGTTTKGRFRSTRHIPRKSKNVSTKNSRAFTVEEYMRLIKAAAADLVSQS